MPYDPRAVRAFTLTGEGGWLRELITDGGISAAFDPQTTLETQPPIFPTKALWDTGATGSVVTKSVARAANLKPVGLTRVNHAGGVSEANVYLVNVFLPNDVCIFNVSVTECEDSDTFGIIIGMDVMRFGDLAMTNVNGITVMSFRFPSCETIDYVKEAQIKLFANVSRNAPCPCGSGKKFKHCHKNVQI